MQLGRLWSQNFETFWLEHEALDRIVNLLSRRNFLRLRTARLAIGNGRTTIPWPCNEALEEAVAVCNNREAGFEWLQNDPKS
jgi:hypothetical protein